MEKACETCSQPFEVRTNVATGGRFCSYACAGMTRVPAHGHSCGVEGRSPTYRSWESMRRRCNTPTSPDYARYGARGIAVCPQWDSFVTFLADMGERPVGMSLDRIDNSAGYSPENCRWATAKEQAQNRRPIRVVTYQGNEWTVTDLASHLGLVRRCLVSRIKRHWPEERWAEARHN